MKKLTDKAIQQANIIASKITSEQILDETWNQLAELFLNDFVNIQEGEKLAKIRKPIQSPQWRLEDE
jgi:hypothetical protein